MIPTPEQEQRIEARRNAKLPNTTCSLGNNHFLTCDDCRDMVSIDYQNRNYFCIKEFVTHRFRNLMKQTGRNIEIRWSTNYLTEKVNDDNDESVDRLDIGVGKEKEGEPLGISGEADQPRTCEAELTTEDSVGREGGVYGG